MTRRNTYVCSERTTADRHSVIQNGKENRYMKCLPMVYVPCLHVSPQNVMPNLKINNTVV